MKLLALETANEHCSVSLFQNGHSQFFQLETRARAQTQAILPMIEQGLEQLGWSINTLDAIAFSRGPGSFSGVRINAAVAQALAWSHDLPVVPVSTLQALAQRAYDQLGLTEVTTVIDARMNEVYIANFQFSDGLMQLIDSEQLKDYASAAQFAQFSLVGSGALLLETAHAQYPDVQVSSTEIGKIATVLAEKKQWVDAEHALPVYLRDNAWKKISEQGKAV